MGSLRSNRRGVLVRDLHRRVKARPASGWTLAIPLIMVGLAGCGGASDAQAPAPSAATPTAPRETQIHQARHSCKLDGGVFSEYATLGDDDHTITMQGAPEDPTYANILKVTGLTDGHIACVLTAVSVPDSVVSQIDATRALDGMQKASWDRFAATWTYHPDNGLNVILTESK